jgi:signal transduction histidine kinase
LLDGQAVYQPCNFEPGALLREVCQLHREATRGADVREDFDALPPVVHGDPKLLFALFSNLLSNAVKYSGSDVPVEVTARGEHGEGLMVRVRDHGIGIPECDRPHLFERYFRGAGAGVVGVAGSGVGLHLVAMVLEMHGGTIEVESCEGGGSSFVVRLPTTP